MCSLLFPTHMHNQAHSFVKLAAGCRMSGPAIKDTYICAQLVSTEEAANVDKLAVQVAGSVVCC